MKRSITTALLSVIFSGIPFTIYGWTKTYGGDGRQEGRHIVSASDGNYVIVGVNKDDLWLLKVDPYGDTLWTHSYDGGGGDRGEYVQQTIDGDYIITGGTHLVDDTGDVCLLKIDPDGNIVWTREYGESGLYQYDFGDVVQQTRDGGFVIIGKTSYGVAYALWVFKVDTQGDVVWSHKFEITMSFGHAGTLTSDGGTIIAGNWDLIKIDSLGDTLWTQRYGEYNKAVSETSDGNYIIVSGESFTFLVEKITPQGNLIWIREYESVSYAAGRWKATIQEIPDSNGFIVTGFPSIYGEQSLSRSDIWLLRLDPEGDTVWTRTYGFDGVQESCWLTQTPDRGYMIVGFNEIWETDTADLWLLRTNEYGDTVWYEGEPREVPVPRPDTLVDTIIPEAWFKNSGTYPIEDFYCDCEIAPKVSGSLAPLSPPYHCRYLISYPVEPGDSVLVKFAEWFADDSSRCVARFYTSKDSEPIWQTREKTVEFQGVPDVGIAEDAPGVLLPSFEVVSSFGREVILNYSNYQKGFRASVYDASGRRVDEIDAVASSGTITWGKCYGPGVYFIVPQGASGTPVRAVIVK